MTLATHILFGLRLDSFKFVWKALVVVISFLSFNGINHACLLKISITHHKIQIPILSLLINCISARSALKIVFS